MALVTEIKYRCISCRAYIADDKVRKAHLETFKDHNVITAKEFESRPKCSVCNRLLEEGESVLLGAPGVHQHFMKSGPG